MALYTPFLTVIIALTFGQMSLAQAISNDHRTNRTTGSLRFTIPDQHGFPENESQKHFDCLDKIYAVTELANLDKGKHEIEFQWTGPNGASREHTKYDFYITNKPSTQLWAWLELSRAKGAAMIQWINPAAGLEEFIGVWEVELFVDGKSLKKGEFEVSC